MQKIVVGIDGSESSKKALRWAVDNGGKAEIVAVHAYDVFLPAPDATPGLPPDLVGLAAEIHEGAIGLVTSVVEAVAGRDATVTATAVEGPPVDVLMETAADGDLLVVGSHGAGLGELLLGSVSLECVERASGPVLIHRG